MPTCKECGTTLPRLQWTHFKYKCTGKFNNGKEYILAYPDETLVDEDVAKKTAVTLENLVSKYGEEEGTERWNMYKSRQAESNSYEYKKNKHGWTKDQFNSFNKSRAVTLDNLVKKHGEEKGTSMWVSYCERQAYTNTLDYFIEQHGPDIGTEKYNTMISQKVYVNKTGSLASKLEMDLIENLEKELSFELEYTYKTGQLYVAKETNHVLCDIAHGNKIIEVYGDYWHCSPEKFPPEYYNVQTKKTAKETWEKDLAKVKACIESGYEVMVVWENEYRRNKQETLERMKEWILKGKE